MNNLIKYLIPLACLSVCALNAIATATQVITFSVGAIEALSVSGTPAPLIITSAVPGSPLGSACDNSTTYNITTNLSGEMISGAIDAQMPENTTLSIQLAAPKGASSAGPINLSDIPQILVTGISQVAQSELNVAYVFSVNPSVKPFLSMTRTVILTLGP